MLKKGWLATGTALAALAFAIPGAAFAQATSQETPEAATATGAAPAADRDEEIIVTGSRIRQNPNNSPVPLQIITTQELQKNSISSPEQLVMFLTANGTGPENLASNVDVVSGAQRGTNGLSSANLRGQGNSATLVLLNGRRVAAHGLSGSAVDVNQIPFAAIERVEVLKDGASAIYGADAVGGVINFITKKDFEGLNLQGFSDTTEAGGGEIYQVSGLAGWGDLEENRFNIMGGVSYRSNEILRGVDRDFVNGNQPNRGLSIDTRGAPIATVFNTGPSAGGFQPPHGNPPPGVPGTDPTLRGTLLGGLTLTAPNGANAAAGGINILDLPGGAGCESMDGGMAYDELLWQPANPTGYYACAWDTSRAAVLQQPVDTLTYYARGVVRIGASHEVSLEITGSEAESAKSFSHNQLSSNTTSLPIAYPLNSLTEDTYNEIFDAIRGAFTNPAQLAALDANYGKPIGYRWRCIPCGTREYVTNTETFRGALGIEGPLFWEGWDYHAGASYAQSESSSVLGTGFHYRGTLNSGAPDPLAPTAPGVSAPGFVGILNSGLLNPFSLEQTPEALAALAAVSAQGATLYGGRYEVNQVDASISGPLFPIWGGDVQVAAGVDYRRETYEFNGSEAAVATEPVIFNVAFDNINALTPKERTVKAAYVEVLAPITHNLDVTAAVRVDEYTGFGSTTNPKFSVRFHPVDAIAVRGSYNTSFRVPTFNQIYNGTTISPFPGLDLADPFTCPGGVPSPAPGCEPINPSILTGGNPNLGPETAEQFSFGIVFTPSPNFSASIDWWSIDVDGTITEMTLAQLVANAAFFPERFARDPATDEIVAIDRRWINAGARQTEGLEIVLRGAVEGLGGTFSAGLDGTYLLEKRERLFPTAPFSASQIGVFTFTGDLGLEWKHNAFLNYANDDFNVTLTQLFRDGYKNQVLPGIAAGVTTRPDFNERVENYVVYNAAVSYTGIDGYRLTFGVRNVFDEDPPFAISYESSSGAGGAWEPRVADPRGRSFVFQAEAEF